MAEIKISSFRDLSKVSYFSNFCESTLESLLPLIKVKYIKIGELLLGGKQVPSEIYFLIDGQLRQHVNHPQSRKRLTLKVHQEPYIAGLASYHAQLPIEFVTAASDCTLIEFNLIILIQLRKIIKTSKSCFLIIFRRQIYGHYFVDYMSHQFHTQVVNSSNG